jgi:outer membrane protein TolC
MKSAPLPQVVAGLLLPMLAACSVAPPQAPPDPVETARQFGARRLDGVLPDAPVAADWDRAQWLRAALLLNPHLQEVRAEAAAVAAGERTAAQRPNPTLNLFGDYFTAAGQSAAWLYGLSLEFVLQRPGERSRARRAAALQTQAAQADVAEAIWQLRSRLRQSLLDSVAARDEAPLLQALCDDRQALLASARLRVQAGESARGEALAAELELQSAQQRLRQAQLHGLDAKAGLAESVGVRLTALQEVQPRWDGWAQADVLAAPDQDAARWRDDALVARPELVRALREYDLAENAVQQELGRRWPQLHLSPGYAWDRGGARENQFDETLGENQLGLNLELPLFNRNEGPIGEALARRERAGRHVLAVQAQLLAQIDRAEQAWPAVLASWRSSLATEQLAARQQEAVRRAYASGAADRPALLEAEAAALESRLLELHAAYETQLAFAALEDAYRRPLEGPERELAPAGRVERPA